ncbi:uncharacterized protein LOC143221794 [Lasioglossum baleicum]|uniref:uncharacterized protein LOC143221794 n=1 Tax=Lasioglossum baleicum TaxID=434251 RepID=UPI003FCDC793
MSDSSNERTSKRFKPTIESTIEDCASTIRDIADSVESISNRYRNLLKVNKAVVMYCLEVENREKKSSMGEIESTLQKTTLEESQ